MPMLLMLLLLLLMPLKLLALLALLLGLPVLLVMGMLLQLVAPMMLKGLRAPLLTPVALLGEGGAAAWCCWCHLRGREGRRALHPVVAAGYLHLSRLGKGTRM